MLYILQGRIRHDRKTEIVLQSDQLSPDVWTHGGYLQLCRNNCELMDDCQAGKQGNNTLRTISHPGANQARQSQESCLLLFLRCVCGGRDGTARTWATNVEIYCKRPHNQNRTNAQLIEWMSSKTGSFSDSLSSSSRKIRENSATELTCTEQSKAENTQEGKTRAMEQRKKVTEQSRNRAEPSTAHQNRL